MFHWNEMLIWWLPGCTVTSIFLPLLHILLFLAYTCAAVATYTEVSERPLLTGTALRNLDYN